VRRSQRPTDHWSPASTAPGPLPVRRVAFDYPADLDPAWNRRFPEFAFASNSISLLMPYAEPYFVASVRSALPDLDDDLARQTETYLKQELQHYRQHRRFNDLMVARYPSLLRLERWIKRTYGWLGRTRRQRFNVAFAAGSETIAYALARWTEVHLGDLFPGSDPVASTLFLWHLAEEIEHKSAAYDVFEAIDGSRLRYTMAMTLSFALLVWFTALGTMTMLHAERRLFRPTSLYRLFKWSFSLGFSILPTMMASAMPGHHPSDFSDPIYLPSWLEQYDADTGTIPVPSVCRAPAA
jgi:predicted metal-dependent hydrolase